MATVTGLTADRMLQIEAESITSAAVDSSGHFILTRHDGTQIDAGTLPNATTTSNGVVELAADADVVALTDPSKAVTALSLSSTVTGIDNRLTALESIKVTILSEITETSLQSAYPNGVSLMNVSAWSLNGGAGTVVTNNDSSTRCQQTFYSASGGTSLPTAWARHYNTSDGGGGWTAWAQIMMMANLNPASFSQTTAFTSYPQGQSRLYFTSTESGAWDFATEAGEVITYRDGTDFARQTWTKHQGGSGSTTETWVRTANSSSGWADWLIIAEDTGWVPLTLNSGFTEQVPVAVRRNNGVVYFTGSFTVPSNTGGTYNTALTIPDGFIPSVDCQFPVSSNTSIHMSAEIIASTGALGTWVSSSTGAWFSLAGISYPIG